jgi:four helix bundle protein
LQPSCGESWLATIASFGCSALPTPWSSTYIASTNGFPAEERCGLQTQLRRAAISTASNIVEGSARRTTREYAHFINLSVGSAAETDDLLDVARRLGYLSSSEQSSLAARYQEVLRGLQSLINALQKLADKETRPPEARSP